MKVGTMVLFDAKNTKTIREIAKFPNADEDKINAGKAMLEIAGKLMMHALAQKLPDCESLVFTLIVEPNKEPTSVC